MSENLWFYKDRNELAKISANLIVHSAAILKNAYIIKNIDLLKDRLDSLNTYGPSKNTIMTDFLMEALIDNIRIIIFFENYLKAILLKQAYCIYKISREYNDLSILHKNQEKRPIHMQEIIDVGGYILDENKQIFTHPGITTQTVSFSTLYKYKKQCEFYDVPAEILSFVNKINIERNRLHFNDRTYFTFNDEHIRIIKQIMSFCDIAIFNHYGKYYQ